MNEATEIGWMRCWAQHLVPAAVHLDAWAHSCVYLKILILDLSAPWRSWDSDCGPAGAVKIYSALVASLVALSSGPVYCISTKNPYNPRVMCTNLPLGSLPIWTAFILWMPGAGDRDGKSCSNFCTDNSPNSGKWGSRGAEVFPPVPSPTDLRRRHSSRQTKRTADASNIRQHTRENDVKPLHQIYPFSIILLHPTNILLTSTSKLSGRPCPTSIASPAAAVPWFGHRPVLGPGPRGQNDTRSASAAEDPAPCHGRWGRGDPAPPPGSVGRPATGACSSQFEQKNTKIKRCHDKCLFLQMHQI